MPLVEDLKQTAERLTRWQRPSAQQLARLPRAKKAKTYFFADDGFIPNNPRWPVLVYAKGVTLPRGLDPAAVLEDLFERNGWGQSWRAGIYDYLHYHSQIHEVLGVARGTVRVRLGGAKGRTFKLSAGDVVILPAGTGHQCLGASKTFLCVGAYPPTGTYDECLPDKHACKAARGRVRRVARPRQDPLFGKDGGLLQYWETTR